jgi:protein-S-isoprenylcysteine O-methyltransferase Ste14
VHTRCHIPRGRLGRDRGTRIIVALSLAGSIWVGILLRGWVPALDTPAPNAFAAAGIVVLWVSLAVRVWAALTLGGLFSTLIQVDADQAVVTRGPYRWVRQPSYTGLLLVALGFGLAAGRGVRASPVLGDEYRSYQRATHRIVPGLW